MLAKKPVGRNASTLKYDILSALAVYGLAGSKHRHRQILRIATLITCRYNWQYNELSIGQKEIARLWSVNERTVKREMARLRELGWVCVKRPSTRGRVALYELDLTLILEATKDIWPLIGPDFVMRMQPEPAPPPSSNIVPFQNSTALPQVQGTDMHSLVLADLQTRSPELFTAWFRHLQDGGKNGDIRIVTTPTRFMTEYIATHLKTHVMAAFNRIDGSITDIQFQVHRS